VLAVKFSRFKILRQFVQALGSPSLDLCMLMAVTGSYLEPPQSEIYFLYFIQNMQMTIWKI